jgi:basic amino acid/polyamine antiporter, APA family
MPEQQPSASPGLVAPRRELGLGDAVAIVVGIVVGSGIYETTPRIAACVSNEAWLFGCWTAGALFALVGALGYAELATAFPHSGGDYVYLSRAFGRPVGFLFAWAQLWIVRPGSIGMIGFVYGRYADTLLPLGPGSPGLHAASAIIGLSAIHLLGVRQGKWVQNLFTAAKVLGLATVFAVGFACGPATLAAAPPAPAASSNLALAMIFVLFTYSGWNEMAYVAAEVREPSRNIARALVLGTLAVAAIYLAANWAFLRALGFAGLQSSRAVASDVAALGLGDRGAQFVAILVCISALGAIHGMLFTGARIFYALGREHRWYAPLGRWSPRFQTPVTAIVAQAGITLALVIGFGSPRTGGADGFGRLTNFTTPVFWLGLFGSSLALPWLRLREPDLPRPFRAPWFPLTSALFIGGAGYMLYASGRYAIENRSTEAFWAIGVMTLGLLLATRERGPRNACG